MQNIALLGPVTFLILVSIGSNSEEKSMVVPLVTAALGLSSFSLAGLYW